MLKTVKIGVYYEYKLLILTVAEEIKLLVVEEDVSHPD